MLILAILFVITRFGFLASFPHFYDSPEYVRLAQEDTFFEALRSSHESLHPIYLFLIQVFYKTFGTVQSLSSVSAIFGLVSVACCGWLLYELGFKEKIKPALLLLLVFPSLWLLHTNIMHESVGHAFLLVGTASLFRWLTTHQDRWAFGAVASLALAYFNYVGLILWFPVIVALVWWKGLSVTRTMVVLGLSLIGGQSSLWFLMQQAGIEQTGRFGYIFSVELPQILQLITPLGFLRILRNVVFMIVLGYSPLIVVGLWKRWRKRDVVLMSVVVFALMASMSFWHGGLYGRLGSLIGFFLAGMMTTFSIKSLRYQLVLWSSLLLFAQSILAYSQKPQAIRQFYLIRDYDVVIISDSQRPQLEYLGLKKYLVISPQNITATLPQIDSALAQGKKVLITKQAITTPYWQYDGQQLHIISKGKFTGILDSYLQHKNIRLVAGTGLLAVYELLVQ